LARRSKIGRNIMKPRRSRCELEADDPRPQLVPALDWLNQKGLAALLGVTPHTAAKWAKAGRLRRYEHGVATCGRRRYSRMLLLREQQHRLEQAIRRQDSQLVERGDA
jgi:hypothetical protein